MDEELIKIKYRNILNNLYKIKNKYQDLSILFDELDSTIRNNMLIDDKIISEDSFNKKRDSLDFLNQELINEIIPRVSNRT